MAWVSGKGGELGNLQAWGGDLGNLELFGQSASCENYHPNGNRKMQGSKLYWTISGLNVHGTNALIRTCLCQCILLL